MRVTIGKRIRWKDLGIVDKTVLVITWIAICSLLLSYSSVYISPADFWVPAFFGLLFPYIFWVNFALVFYWAIRKARMWVIPATLLLTGWNYIGAWYQWNSPGKPLNPEADQVEIVSYNVRLFDLYNWSQNKKTRNEIFEFLLELDANVLCFQEFYHRNGGQKFETKDTMVTFLRATHFFEHYTHEMRGDQYFGLATFSSYPIVGNGAISFENDKNNACIWTDLEIGDDTVRIYNAHLSSIRLQREDYQAIGDEESTTQFKKHKEGQQRIISRLRNAYVKRVSQSNKVLDHVKKSPYPVVLCGDFNDTPISYCYSLFDDLLVDAFRQSGSGRGGTYLGRFPDFRIDYIFHSDDIHSYGFATHDIELSDHRPISCIFELRD